MTSSKKKPLIYVAHPLTTPEPMQNTHDAMNHWELVMAAGAVAICPHWSLFHNVMHPHDWEFWLSYDEELIARCDAVFRPEPEKPSRGADREQAFALQHNIPLITDYHSLRTFIQNWNAEGE